MKPYLIIESPDGSLTLHHPSWGQQEVTLRPNGEIDVHARKIERAPVLVQRIRIPRA